jgi:hypothetical protein
MSMAASWALISALIRAIIVVRPLDVLHPPKVLGRDLDDATFGGCEWRICEHKIAADLLRALMRAPSCCMKCAGNRPGDSFPL